MKRFDANSHYDGKSSDKIRERRKQAANILRAGSRTQSLRLKNLVWRIL